jgi:LacI family transcriptional regulator, repressor for deo operon, udp, cdd, tsx, nupC, and nupG
VGEAGFGYEMRSFRAMMQQCFIAILGRPASVQRGLLAGTARMADELQARRTAHRVSLTDVAARAGVSAATASRSLRGVSKVAPGTRQRVLDAARELSYVAAFQPQGAGFGPQRTIAVIVPFVTRWFFATATGSAIDFLRARGYDVLLYHLGSAAVRDEFFARMPLAGRVEGILSLSMPLSEQHTLSLRALDLPLVSLGAAIPGSPSVAIDDVRAAKSAVNHLLNLRHQRIALIAGTPDDPGFEFPSSVSRRLGYEDALNSAGVEFDPGLVVAGPHGIRGGAEAMTELLSRPGPPTAVFAEYADLAIGALWALRRAGLVAPDDLSVVSIDDNILTESLDLTTVDQDVERQARVAAGMLLQLLGVEDGEPPSETVLVPTRLVLRGTTSPPSSRSSSRQERPPAESRYLDAP